MADRQQKAATGSQVAQLGQTLRESFPTVVDGTFYSFLGLLGADQPAPQIAPAPARMPSRRGRPLA